jgi:hypothetical protein
MTTLEEIEKTLMEGGESRAKAISAMKEILSSISSCRNSMRDLRSDVVKFHDNCKDARTVGTTLNVVGGILTAGLFELL